MGAACIGYVSLFTLAKNFGCLQLETLRGAGALDHAVETKGTKN